MNGFKYRPEIDGMRALAALAVVAFHARVPGFAGGYVGVDFFFVLSGYLITNVIRENSDLKCFYIRRAKRLVPPLAMMLGVYLAVFPLITPDHPHWRDAVIAFFYLSDYATAFWKIPDLLRHTWSLSVEEHFYLIWPLLFIYFKPTTKALFFIYIIATAWRWGWQDWWEAYARFDTRLSGLILGCLLANISIRDSFPAWPGLLVLMAACSSFSWGLDWIQGWGFLIVEVAAAVIILGQSPKWLSDPQLVYMGQLSYGIYLWHYPIARLLRDAGMGWEVTMAVSLSVSILFSAASYHFFEVYFRSGLRKSAPAFFSINLKNQSTFTDRGLN